MLCVVVAVVLVVVQVALAVLFRLQRRGAKAAGVTEVIPAAEKKENKRIAVRKKMMKFARLGWHVGYPTKLERKLTFGQSALCTL